MYPVFGLLVLVLDIVAIINCIQSSMDSGKKVLWILLILILPLLGPILYWHILLGRKSGVAVPEELAKDVVDAFWKAFGTQRAGFKA